MAEPIPSDSSAPAPGTLPLDYAAEQEKFRVGTLQYVRASLFGIFSWMIWGNLCFSLFESAGGPDILKLYLQDNFQVSNLTNNILFNFIPMIIGTFMTPIISFKSDRTRSRLGRRIPYILYTAPFLVLFATGLGFSDEIIRYCKNTFAGHSIVSPFTAALVIIGFLTVGFSLFNEFVGTVYYYLLPDVVPKHFIGRFQGISQAFGTLISIFVNLYIVPIQETNLKAVHVGVAILYFVGFGLLCWRVREGRYPPVTDVTERTRFRDQVRLYFRECFCHPIFILFYASTAVTMLARGLNPAAVFHLHLSEHQSSVSVQHGADNALAMTPDGKLSITGGADGSIKLLDISNIKQPKILKTFDCHVGAVRTVAFSHDAHLAIVGGDNGNVEIWDLGSGRTLQFFPANAGGVRSVAVAPDDSVIASAGADHLVSLWDMRTGHKLRTLSGHQDTVNSVAFASQNDRLVSGGQDSHIILWNYKTGDRITTITNTDEKDKTVLEPVYAVTFMPSLIAPPQPAQKMGSGAVFTKAGHSLGIFFHTVFTNESLYDPHNPRTSEVAAQDGWIVSGGRGLKTDADFSFIRIWDQNGELLHSMKGHKRAVTSLGYKPDLRIVYSGSLDGSIRLWKPLELDKTADDQAFKMFSGYTRAVNSVACADRGVSMIDASADGAANMWNIDEGISLYKNGRRGVFFNLLGILLGYPIGAFVDRRNPFRVTIIATILGLPFIFAYFFFYHSYLFGFWADLLRYPLSMLTGIAMVPMTIALYPKSKYGQFASANALVRQAVGAIAGIIGAIIMDRLTANSLNTDNYRYGYIFQFVVQVMSVAALIAVYVYWKKLGGPNYMAPEREAKEDSPEFEPQ